VPIARRHVAAWLGSRGARERLVDDIALAVSEACTNVVVHGAAASFRVIVEQARGLVTITVTDDGAGMSPRPDSPGLGLGLPLIATLTRKLEIGPASGGGTVVSMVFEAV
jgi:serine/threonine-protein kinase RsbW/stage II sporulation protein AB (anti-sigma F factor)